MAKQSCLIKMLLFMVVILQTSALLSEEIKPLYIKYVWIKNEVITCIGEKQEEKINYYVAVGNKIAMNDKLIITLSVPANYNAEIQPYIQHEDTFIISGQILAAGLFPLELKSLDITMLILTESQCIDKNSIKKTIFLTEKFKPGDKIYFILKKALQDKSDVPQISTIKTESTVKTENTVAFKKEELKYRSGETTTDTPSETLQNRKGNQEPEICIQMLEVKNELPTIFASIGLVVSSAHNEKVEIEKRYENDAVNRYIALKEQNSVYPLMPPVTFLNIKIPGVYSDCAESYGLYLSLGVPVKETFYDEPLIGLSVYLAESQIFMTGGIHFKKQIKINESKGFKENQILPSSAEIEAAEIPTKSKHEVNYFFGVTFRL